MDYLSATRLSLIAAFVFGSLCFIQNRSKPPTSDPWFVPVIFILIVVSYKDV